MTAKQSEIDPLTGREQDILRLMMAGQTNTEIASELVISVETVRWYTKQIYNKLGVHSRTQAVLRSRDLGLVAVSGEDQSGRRLVSAPRVQLPRYTTPFVGRESDLQEAAGLLARPHVRLLTVAGPGGMGKTRFCVELAHQIHGRFFGVYFIPLAALDTCKAATIEVAHQLGLHLSSGQDPIKQIAAYLQNKKILLILDNMEHLPGGPAWVKALLDATNHLKLIVSSQSSLNVAAEWVRYLQGISYPLVAATKAHDTAAVQLFAERAQRIRADFDLNQNFACVVEICRRLEGLPLALELAAAWLKSLTCDQIVAEIERGADRLVTRQPDTMARHHSLPAIFDYSWKLLSDRERRMLLRLSPFRGGFSRTTASAVVGADLSLLSSLVDKSFLTFTSEGDRGSYLFHELLRRYAVGLLAQQDSSLLTTRSGKLLLWSLFVQGDFRRAERLAADILSSSLPGTREQAFGLALTAILAGMAEAYDRCREISKVAAALADPGPHDSDPLTDIFVHLGLAVAACGFGEYDQIQQHAAAALALALDMDSPAFVLLCLPVSAVFLAHIAETEAAMRLLALAFNHPAHTSTWLEKWPLLTSLQTEMAAELSEARCAALWQAGKDQDLATAASALLARLQSAWPGLNPGESDSQLFADMV